MNIKKSIHVSILLLLLATPFFIRPHLVRGSSMAPTLRDGRVMLVETVSLRIFEPRRGSLIVFYNPHREMDGDKVSVDVKRVVGLPGETVHVRSDHVVITRACDSGTPGNPRASAISEGDGPCQITYASSTTIGGGSTGKNTNEFDMFLGPVDYFVLGDNRGDSSDSRIFGAVQPVDLIGRVLISL